MAEEASEEMKGINATEKYTKKFDPEEISPLKQPKQVTNSTNQDTSVTVSDSPEVNPPKKKTKYKITDHYESVIAQLELNKRSQTVFLCLIGLCIVLVVVLISMIVFWPRIHDYMTAEVCVDKECLDASAQILRWSNISLDPCQDPFEWSCGKFDSEFQHHSFHGMQRGEWNFNSHLEYEEISEIHSFISKLPKDTVSYSAQVKMKVLHKNCMNLESSDDIEGMTTVNKAIANLDGFWILGDSLLVWDFRKQFVKLQSEYGVSPFVQIRVENRKSPPHDGIIVIDEGEVSLPSKMFYRLGPRSEIVEGFKILLRDVAILMGVVHDRAKQFAEDIFNYEKRIVNTINVTQQNDDREINKEVSLGSVMKIAPSLPLLDIITTLYPNSRVTENTMVLVKDLEVLRSMSIVVSTTDIQVLNMYLIWSLIRRFLPFISRDYRIALEEFESKLYGFRDPPPKWYFCTKLVRDWMSFGVDVLRENPQLIVLHQKDTTHESKVFFSEKFTIDQNNNSDELVKLIFYHIRNELKSSVNDDGRISESLRTFISDRLSAVALQIGIPDDAAQTDEFLNSYYEDFTPQRLYFLNNLRYRWKFIKARTELRLTNQTRSEKLINALYPISDDEERKFVQFHPELNTVVVSRRALRRPYFHQNYPLSVNFAHIGKDFVEVIVEAIKFHQESHARMMNSSRTTSGENKSIHELFRCLTKKSPYDTTSVPIEAQKKLYVDIESNRILLRAFKSFLKSIDHNVPIYDSTVPETVTYDSFGLRRRLRQPGLRIFSETELLVLSQLQRYCVLDDASSYDRIKVFMEMEFPRREIFQILWHHVPELSKALSCDVDTRECRDVL
ncbi:protein gone early [Phlebotomus argentipes]|uniref:protein gone early n=1 Tax=Phlebotomus argentipes TaxID=94469 RepID=UPI0028936F2C|nr:protein gone early [Phlebotomus argentipes]XP_059616554.1 protein gone early [Phlebotomus argentipes]